MGKYYDGTKLLSLKDINGNTPEIYICTSNRTAGKTTYFNRMVVNRFKRTGEKFALLYRYKYEIDGCVDKFFGDINSLFFPTDEMTSISRASKSYIELLLNGQSCGYVITLNSADLLKKYSHMFSDVGSIIFDEFQSETNDYCPEEIRKFMSIHTSIARGQGEQVRYVPVYMISNPVTIINPYYTEFGISTRLQSNTKFLRGDGWVLEQGHNESAEEAQAQSAFMRAFSGNSYTKYSMQGVYLNDNLSFVEKLTGKSRYICTVLYKGKQFAIREFTNENLVYCDESVDSNFPVKITISSAEHTNNFAMMRTQPFLIEQLRMCFEYGNFRFRNLNCKEAVLKLVSY